MKTKQFVVLVVLLLVVMGGLVYLVTKPSPPPSDVGARLTAIEDRLSVSEAQQAALLRSVAVLAKSLDGVRAELGELRRGLDDLSKRVAALETVTPPKRLSRDEDEHRVPMYVPRHK